MSLHGRGPAGSGGDGAGTASEGEGMTYRVNRNYAMHPDEASGQYEVER